MAVSNRITAILNFLIFLSSIPVIAAGIWLASKPDNECVQLLRWPVVVLGGLLLLVSLIGFVGAYCNRPGFLAVYLFCMALLILLLLILLVIAFTVTRPDGSHPVAGSQFQEYRLDGYSSWLRNHVTSSGSWQNVRTCLAVSDVCPKLDRQFSSAHQFFAADISPLQSGCCKPPAACGYTYETPTTWVNPENPTSDPDCLMWSNERTRLCYDCSGCKAGLLGNLRQEWRKANAVLIVAVVVLIFVYLVACAAYKNAQIQNISVRYKHGWI
ncbi:tetraspanin-2-like isoform X1 [Cucurbita maxima]|uniref:Tetraspanin-2-like isoform X1 n=1 Tax=Cucurbita maxima TaxID=3661 RepID=A0A6J1I9D5_CUCMA|nr:tetraspanin-2-like isoform X1 [Cucurbita maxima]